MESFSILFNFHGPLTFATLFLSHPNIGKPFNRPASGQKCMNRSVFIGFYTASQHSRTHYTFSKSLCWYGFCLFYVVLLLNKLHRNMKLYGRNKQKNHYSKQVGNYPDIVAGSQKARVMSGPDKLQAACYISNNKKKECGFVASNFLATLYDIFQHFMSNQISYNT